MNPLRITGILLLTAIVAPPLHADPALEVKAAEKLEIHHSMMGFRDTLLFYTFENRKIILVLNIDNKDETFPVSGKVHIFDENTTAEALKKWINNQHSDGLFIDPAKPAQTIDLSKESFEIISRELVKTSKNRGPGRGESKEFLIGLKVSEIRIDDTRKLAPFTEKARVHVRSIP